MLVFPYRRTRTTTRSASLGNMRADLEWIGTVAGDASWFVQIPGMRRGLAPDGTNLTRVVGDGGNRGRAEEMRGVALTSYQRDVALALPPLCMAHDHW